MRAARLTILMGTDDHWHHRPVYHEIVARARSCGLAGATVLRGCEGFGSSSFVHTDRSVDLADNLPIAVIIVDDEERVRAFVRRIEDLPGARTAFLDHVDVLGC